MLSIRKLWCNKIIVNQCVRQLYCCTNQLLIQSTNNTTLSLCNYNQRYKSSLASNNSTKSKPTNTATTIPLLSYTLRQFIRLVHPDLYANSPVQQQINSHNMQLLMNIFNDIKSNDANTPYPVSGHYTLTFYIRNELLVNNIKKQYSNNNNNNNINNKIDISTIDNIITQCRYNAIDASAGKSISHKLIKQMKQSRSKNINIPSDIWSGWYISRIDNDYISIGITISLNGGSCKKLIEKACRVLFALSGLQHDFIVDDIYFKPKPGQQRMTDDMYNDNIYESEQDEYDRLMRQQEEIDKKEQGYA